MFLKQLARFGVVGFSAATVHFLAVVFLVEIHQWHPLIANMIGFLTAFQLSYWGHRQWTFQQTTALHRVAFPKLLLLNTIVFVLNEGVFYILLSWFTLPYPLALFLVITILPALSFMVSKFWVFKSV